MFSFLILVFSSLISIICSFIKDIGKNNYKNVWKLTAKIILLLIAVYLKSINL